MFIRMNEMFAHILGKDLIGVVQTGYVDKLEHQLCFVPARYKVGYSTNLNRIQRALKVILIIFISTGLLSCPYFE